MELLRRAATRRSCAKESGMALIVTLIVMILITLATVSIVRSMDTSNVISGNFAFKETARNVADRGITDAFNDLQEKIADNTANVDEANFYYSTRQAANALGVPTGVTWSSVNCKVETNDVCDNDDMDKYRVRYIVERQCDQNPDLNNIDDVKSKCDFLITQPASGANPEKISLQYRIIVRVDGPRNTQGMYEVMVSGPGKI